MSIIFLYIFAQHFSLFKEQGLKISRTGKEK